MSFADVRLDDLFIGDLYPAPEKEFSADAYPVNDGSKVFFSTINSNMTKRLHRWSLNT